MLSGQASHVHWVVLEKEVCNHTEVAHFSLQSTEQLYNINSDQCF